MEAGMAIVSIVSFLVAVGTYHDRGAVDLYCTHQALAEVTDLRRAA